ncbi:MAG: hypothetical protein KF774_20170 [Planctomyces sp.]|nr:hypothetical protein [Planctomyces sp.]
MDHQHPERGAGPAEQLQRATTEMLAATTALVEWRGTAASTSETHRLEQLQAMLKRMESIDQRSAASRRELSQHALGGRQELKTYEQALAAAIDEIRGLEELLGNERSRLEPRLDAAARDRDVRSAYARALSQR